MCPASASWSRGDAVRMQRFWWLRWHRYGSHADARRRVGADERRLGTSASCQVSYIANERPTSVMLIACRLLHLCATPHHVVQRAAVLLWVHV